MAVIAPRMWYLDGPARRSAWKLRTYINDIANSTRCMQGLLYPIFKNGEYSKKEFSKELLEVEAISGAFFIIKNDILEKIGLLDENTFLFYEEDILGHKIKKLGFKIYSLNSEKFMHYESKSIGKVYNLTKKQEVLFVSRKYYHKNYNNISDNKLKIFDMLFVLRKIELFIEVPLKKLVALFK
ncbi:hypothetical protein D3C73_1254930 [compost metagenome]